MRGPLPLLALFACGVASAQSPFPKTEQEAIALVDALPGCPQFLDFGEPYERPPTMTGMCAGKRETAKFLLEARVGAKCDSLFDLTDSGRATNIRITCVFDPQKPISDAQLKIAQAAIIRDYERRMTEDLRYAPASPQFPAEKRTDLAHGTSFLPRQDTSGPIKQISPAQNSKPKEN